jgi:conjugal transfer pilus assembly protein TraB
MSSASGTGRISIKQWFDQLRPGQRKTVWFCLLATGIVALSYGSYRISRGGAPEAPPRKETLREISLEPDLIEKTTLREQRAQIESLRQELTKMREDPQAFASDRPPVTLPGDNAKGPLRVPSAEEVAGTKPPAEDLPPLPVKPSAYPPPPLPVGAAAGMLAPPPVVEEVIGGIGVLSNPNKNQTADPDKKKADSRKVYLPPSIMTAQLLTGFDAATTNGGKGSPEPVLLRIQTPAILPNDVIAATRGCFIIAEAVGRLDKERADVRLVSMACLSNKGQSLIDESVKGFVTDADAKVGLSARIVSKAGSATARALLAGLIKGAGDALSESSTDQTVSGVTGTTTTTMSNETSDIARRAAGKGISEAADTLSDYFMDLARQTGPVAEVKADRKVTVVISEGKELTIKNVDTKTGV